MVYVSDGADDEYTVHGMENLMLTEFILCVVPLVLAVVYFRDAPPTPPSLSTRHKLETANGTSTSSESSEGQKSSASMYTMLYGECLQLASNKNFIILLVSFSCAMGFLCAFLTLLNQIILPYGYR